MTAETLATVAKKNVSKADLDPLAAKKLIRIPPGVTKIDQNRPLFDTVGGIFHCFAEDITSSSHCPSLQTSSEEWRD